MTSWLRRLSDALGRDPIYGILLVLPLTVWVFATLIYPLAEAIRLSLLDVGYVGMPGRFVGLRNYAGTLSDSEFIRSTRITLLWTVLNTVGIVIAGFIAALVLNQDYRGKVFIRNWIILPWVFPSVVLATLGKWVLDPTLGLANYLLIQVGIIDRGISFLGSPTQAIYMTAALNVWRWFPFFTVIFLAALQTVPREQHESAEIDGATRFARLIHIDVPSIAPVMKVAVLISSLWSINIFDLIWLLTRGGPAFSTTTLPIFIYLKGFQEFRISLAAAAAVIMFVALVVYGVIYVRRLLAEDLEV